MLNKDNFIKDIKNQNHYILKKLSEKNNLDSREIFNVVSNILNGNCSDAFISAVLMSLLIKGETFDEIAGTVEADTNLMQ